MHIYFSHIIPTRKACVIYESCSTSLFIYTRTYTHTHTQSYSRINFHCHCWHTRLLHDLHLCLWTQRHRNPSVEHSRSVRLTFRHYFLFGFTLLSFCHSTEMAPCPSVLDKEIEKKTENRGVRKIVWSRFLVSIQILEARKWKGMERFRGVYRVGYQEKFVVLLENSHFSHSSCGVFLRLSQPSLIERM